MHELFALFFTYKTDHLTYPKVRFFNGSFCQHYHPVFFITFPVYCNGLCYWWCHWKKLCPRSMSRQISRQAVGLALALKTLAIDVSYLLCLYFYVTSFCERTSQLLVASDCNHLCVAICGEVCTPQNLVVMPVAYYENRPKT